MGILLLRTGVRFPTPPYTFSRGCKGFDGVMWSYLLTGQTIDAKTSDSAANNIVAFSRSTVAA